MKKRNVVLSVLVVLVLIAGAVPLFELHQPALLPKLERQLSRPPPA